MSGIRLSDHALVRLIERCGGLDLEAVRGAVEETLARAHDAAASLDARDYLITVDGLVYVVREDTVVTVFRRGSRAARAASIIGPGGGRR